MQRVAMMGLPRPQFNFMRELVVGEFRQAKKQGVPGHWNPLHETYAAWRDNSAKRYAKLATLDRLIKFI